MSIAKSIAEGVFELGKLIVGQIMPPAGKTRRDVRDDFKRKAASKRRREELERRQRERRGQ